MYYTNAPATRIECSVSLPGYAQRRPRLVPEDTEIESSDDLFINHDDFDLFEEMIQCQSKPMTRKQSLRYAR